MTFLANSNFILQIYHAKTFKISILGASTIILSKDIDKYAFMCDSNFYESVVINCAILKVCHTKYTKVHTTTLVILFKPIVF